MQTNEKYNNYNERATNQTYNNCERASILKYNTDSEHTAIQNATSTANVQLI